MKKKLIDLTLLYKIIKTNFLQPITFKSGIKSPIYCNFRESTSHNDFMRLIKEAFVQKLHGKGIEGIIGVAVGGVSYATLTADALDLPSGFIRPGAKAKEYGLKNLIEGMNVEGKVIAIFEDLVSTGGSVLEYAQILMKAGAKKVYIYSIFTYRMATSETEFNDAGYEFDSLMDINDILPEMQKSLNDKDYQSLLDWVRDPEGWFDRHKLSFDFGFLTTLRQSAFSNNSLVSFGIDPVLDSLPESYRKNNISGYAQFITDVFSQMVSEKVLPAMLKPNLGFYLQHDLPRRGQMTGTLALAEIIGQAESVLNIPVIIDAKTGDIGKSSDNYARYFMENWGADGTTVAPYMGQDSIIPYSHFCSAKNKKGIYVLARTSNPGAATLQNAEMRKNGRFYHLTTEMVMELAKGAPGVGVVVGATNKAELKEILSMLAGKDISALIPGVGSQGGSATDVVEIAKEVGYELDLLRINSSSALTHPWYKDKNSLIPSDNECIEMCIESLRKLNNEIAAARGLVLA
jgi:orotidine-5'-phosphate decarboxylase